MKILIDNGHGNNTPGKRSPDGKFLADMTCIEAMELLQDRMRRWGTNDALLQNMDKDM